jgi:3-hydroxybutyryl-CoA dehydrogenase
MIKNIAIIGAGQMGSGIAHVCALGHYDVQVVDISQEQLSKAKKNIANNLDRQVTKGTISQDEKAQALSHIQFTTHVQNPASINLAIEAVHENVDLKIKIFKDLDNSLKTEAILATNTSSISITQLAGSTSRPERVIGMHFMNPPPIMPLVEVIMGEKTSQHTKSTIQEMIVSLGKKPVFSKDSPGFIVNRILMPMINEAIYALNEGVATPEDIDAAIKLGTNQPMGPLELADFIGLDTCLAIMQVLHDGFGAEKYRPCPLLVNYVTSGRLGRKTGRGFYKYQV